MRRLPAFGALAALVLATAGSAQLGPDRDAALAQARTEAAAAAKRATALEQAASRAQGEAATLHAQRLAAAAQVESAEARIAAADRALMLANAEVARSSQRLARRRAPAAALLAGVITMARQPPLLAIADGGSLEELVRVRALLDTTMPVIRRRSTALAAELRSGEQVAALAAAARDELAADKRSLADKQQRFAALERGADRRGASLAERAFGAQDRVLADSEQLADLGSAAAAASAARANARKVAALDLAAPRPFGPATKPSRGGAPPYSLPVNAPLIEGLGSVDPSGVEARGIVLAAPRGAALIVPADGTILFAGAYRDHDGVIIIDHGGGWTTLLLGVATPLARGAAVQRGAPLGRALGDVTVELRRAGVPVSAALIAGSSVPLSNGREIR